MNKNKNLFLDILPAEQLKLWDDLGSTPNHFTLYGGTALALQLGHRQSIDFDFFSNEKFIPQELYESIPYLKNSIIEQETNNTLTCLVDKDNNKIQVSFFGDLELPIINDPIIANNGIKIASAEDVLTTKLKTIINRSSAKDYIDIASGFENGFSLNKLINNTKKLYGNNFNANLSLKALAYFNDVDISKETQSIIIKHLNNFLKSKKQDYDR